MLPVLNKALREQFLLPYLSSVRIVSMVEPTARHFSVGQPFENLRILTLNQ